MQGSTARGLHGDMIAEQPEGAGQRAADRAVPASPMTHRRPAARRWPGGVAQLRGCKQQGSHQSCRHRRHGCAAPLPPPNTPAGLVPARRQSAGLPHNKPPLLHRQMWSGGSASGASDAAWRWNGRSTSAPAAAPKLGAAVRRRRLPGSPAASERTPLLAARSTAAACRASRHRPRLAAPRGRTPARRALHFPDRMVHALRGTPVRTLPVLQEKDQRKHRADSCANLQKSLLLSRDVHESIILSISTNVHLREMQKAGARCSLCSY